tara:strand:- start:39 stop:479 length:441 start_codon:yes stop_codon:yes gene_type:complete
MNTPTPLGKTYEQYEKEVKEYKEINLSKVERVELGYIQDLDGAVKSNNSTLDTADKVIAAANKVNNVIQSVTKEAQYYNKYADLVEQDLKNNIQYLEGVLSKAETQTKQLGIDLKDIPEFKKATANIKESKDYLKSLTSTTLEFDI